MIIVLEGCDGAGKSKLAGTLCDRYDLKYHHEGPPPRKIPPLEHYAGVLESHRWSIKRGEIKGVVFDRFAMGERVYGPIYRNEDRFSDHEWKLFTRLLNAADALHIICNPPFEVCVKNWQRRADQEMVKDVEVLRRIYDTYMLMSKDEWVIHWLYDYTDPSSLNELEGMLSLGWDPLSPGVIGHPKARFLFIGEMGAKANAFTADLPFFGSVNSSGYLNRAIEDAQFREDEIALVNALRHDSQVPEWPKDVVHIALGRVAEQECIRRGITQFESVPHPQHWKRFHASEYDAYVEKLADIRRRANGHP